MSRRRVIIVTATAGAVAAVALAPALGSAASTSLGASCPVPAPPGGATTVPAPPSTIADTTLPLEPESTPPTTDEAIGAPDVTTTSVAASTTTVATPTTTVATPSTVLIAPPTSEFLPTPSIPLVPFPGGEVVSAPPATLDDVTETAGSLPVGLRSAERQPTVDTAPAPRQKIKVDAQLWVDQQTGVLGIHTLLGAAIPDPDPCRVFGGATLTPVAGIPGRYRITIPKLKGRECRIVTFKVRGDDTPARISYSAKDEPTITFDVTEPHGSQVTIVLSCDVPLPRR